jgi:hypothetical protein
LLEDTVTARDLGAVGIKLMGAFFAAFAVMRLLGLVASVAFSPPVEGIDGRSLFRLNGFSVLIELAVAGAFVIKAESLADRMFSSQPLQIAGLSRRDLLIVGIALLGVSTVAGGVPGILRFAGQAIWFAQGTRQAEFFPSMERSWQSLANDVLALVVGGTLLLKAAMLGSALDGCYRRDEQW